jgi:hypothetical protein
MYFLHTVIHLYTCKCEPVLASLYSLPCTSKHPYNMCRVSMYVQHYALTPWGTPLLIFAGLVSCTYPPPPTHTYVDTHPPRPLPIPYLRGIPPRPLTGQFPLPIQYLRLRPSQHPRPTNRTCCLLHTQIMLGVDYSTTLSNHDHYSIPRQVRVRKYTSYFRMGGHRRGNSRKQSSRLNAHDYLSIF